MRPWLARHLWVRWRWVKEESRSRAGRRYGKATFLIANRQGGRGMRNDEAADHFRKKAIVEPRAIIVAITYWRRN